MNAESKLLHFLYTELPFSVNEMMGGLFEENTDPEISWTLFREGLRKLKKKHTELFKDAGESDSEEEAPESEISKWRRLNSL